MARYKLIKHLNVMFNFTPTGSSWLNQVEIWFGIITKQTIRRGAFDDDLKACQLGLIKLGEAPNSRAAGDGARYDRELG